MSSEERITVDPPFDGKPCPCCPMEIRNLAAVAHNLLTVWDDPNRRGKLAQRIDQLRDAVRLVQPLMDAHFADEYHAHRPRPALPLPLPPPTGPEPRQLLDARAHLGDGEPAWREAVGPSPSQESNLARSMRTIPHLCPHCGHPTGGDVITLTSPDLDTQTWDALSAKLQTQAFPNEVRVETLSRLLGPHALLVVFIDDPKGSR